MGFDSPWTYKNSIGLNRNTKLYTHASYTSSHLKVIDIDINALVQTLQFYSPFLNLFFYSV